MAALVVVWACGTALPAAAHAGLAASDPAPGVVLDASPESIRLTFNEPVGPVPTGFVLYDSAGQHSVDGEATEVAVTSVDRVVTVTLPAELARGSYLLSWRVVSADSHPISGALSFAVGEVSATPPPVPDADTESLGNPVNSTFLLLQIAGYLGLFTTVGLRVFETFVLGAGAARDRLRTGVLTASAGVAVGSAGAVAALTWVRERGGRLTELLGTEAWVSGLGTAAGLGAGLVGLGVALLLVAARLPWTWSAVATGAGALIALSSVLTTGHTRTYGPWWVTAAADLVHVATGAVWLGGLVGLALYLFRSHRLRRDPVPVAAVVARFSALAGVLVGLLGISGIVLAVLIVGSVGAIFTTDYGHGLLAKLGLVAVIGLLAVWNKTSLVSAVQHRPDGVAQWRRLRAAVIDEAAIVVVAIAVTGLLTMISPPAGGEAGEAGGRGGSTVTAESATTSTARRSDLGSGSVQAKLLPASVGLNSLEFTLRDSNGAPLMAPELPRVTAALPSAALGPLPAEVTQVKGTNRYRAEVPLPAAGEWRFLISVELSAFDNPTAVVVVPVVD